MRRFHDEFGREKGSSRVQSLRNRVVWLTSVALGVEKFLDHRSLIRMMSLVDRSGRGDWVRMKLDEVLHVGVWHKLREELVLVA